jgi:DNA-directed RNA polymerase specialized sigma subunit
MSIYREPSDSELAEFYGMSAEHLHESLRELYDILNELDPDLPQLEKARIYLEEYEP